MKNLELSKIYEDDRLQIRVNTNEDKISEYQEEIEKNKKIKDDYKNLKDGILELKEGDEENITKDYEALKEFDPIEVWKIGSRHYVVDGFHRLKAYKKAGFEKIKVNLVGTSEEDNFNYAILYALKANSTHGMPRTKEDVENAIKKVLEHPNWKGWSNREIARRCNTTPHIINKVKAKIDFKELPTDKRMVQRGDVVYEQNINKKGTKSKISKELAYVMFGTEKEIEKITEKDKEIIFKYKGDDKEYKRSKKDIGKLLRTRIEEKLKNNKEEDEYELLTQIARKYLLK